jgi:5-methyltetrahydrofolate--homocysteine methyltransferase
MQEKRMANDISMNQPGRRTLVERLRDGDVLVGDGGWGTMLLDRGLQSGEPPEVMNLRSPEVVAEVAQCYVEAGAELVTTNSFGGSGLALLRHNLAEQAHEINLKAAEIVAEAVAGRALVSASVGPCGHILAPYGDADPDEVGESFECQIRALSEGGAEVVCIETMTDIAEMKLAIDAAKRIAPELPIIGTMTFDKTSRGFFTMMGVSLERAASELEEAGVDVIGSNCGNGIEKMVEIAYELRQFTEKPTIIQANAGIPELRDGVLHYPEDPEFYASHVQALVKSGVQIIGGCCGTTPEHIRELKRQVVSVRTDGTNA